MKKVFLLCIVAVLCLSACKEDPLAKIPSFDILLSDSSEFYNTSRIPKGIITAIVRFDADCVECQQETDSILKHINALKDVTFFFVTTENFSQVTLFEKHFNLKKYQNIIIGQDINRITPHHYKSHKTPLTALYDKERKLQVIYEGRIDINYLIAKVDSIKREK